MQRDARGHQSPGPGGAVRGDPGADHARLGDCPGQHLLADDPAEGRCRGLHRQPGRGRGGDQRVGRHRAGTVRAVAVAENVTAASELVRSKGWIEEPYDTSHTSDPWPLLGINGPVYKGKVTAGSLDDLTGSSVALPPEAAKKLKVGVGSELGLRLGDDALVRVEGRRAGRRHRRVRVDPAAVGTAGRAHHDRAALAGVAADRARGRGDRSGRPVEVARGDHRRA